MLDYIKDPSIFQYKDGYIELLQGPGLGVEVNEEALIEASEVEHDWKNPVWRNEDGTVAEW